MDFLARFMRAWSMMQPNTDIAHSAGSQVGRVSRLPRRIMHGRCIANSGDGGVAGPRQPNSGQRYTQYTCDLCKEKGHNAQSCPTEPASNRADGFNSCVYQLSGKSGSIADNNSTCRQVVKIIRDSENLRAGRQINEILSPPHHPT